MASQLSLSVMLSTMLIIGQALLTAPETINDCRFYILKQPTAPGDDDGYG